MLGDHFLFDVGERVFLGGPFAGSLDQSAADISSHSSPPQVIAKEYSAAPHPATLRLCDYLRPLSTSSRLQRKQQRRK
jgi:hypothetical protein